MKPSLRRVAAIALITLVLIGCAAPTGGQTITVENPYARPSPTEGGNGAAFMTVVSAGNATDRLISAKSAAAKAVELHETTEENGVMMMRPMPNGFEIPARGRVELKPGGKHVMLIGLTVPLVAGQEIEITLNFENAGAVTVKVPIKE